MSTKIEKDFSFQAIVYFKNNFLINSYHFTLIINVNTDSILEQNVAMDRIKYLTHEVFQNSVFINENEIAVIKKYIDAGLKVSIIPEDPYDQIIALLLMLKINSVCENRILVSKIILTSDLSDGVRFSEDVETAQQMFLKNGWWNEFNPSLTCTGKTKNKKEKVVKLINNEWNDVGLIWKDRKEKPSEILFSLDTEK